MSPIELGDAWQKELGAWGLGETGGIGGQSNLKDSEAPHAIVVTVGTQVANDTLLLQYPQLCGQICVCAGASGVRKRVARAFLGSL